MNDEMLQLVKCGIPPHEAYNLYHSFVREFGLQEFVESMENDANVG